MKKLLNFFRLLKEHLNGDFAYKNYLKHHREHHLQKEILDKKSFLRKHEENKWQKVNRCC